jgi:two-component system, NarL family, response regulator LiaR
MVTAKIRILIADDHAVLREGMCNLLQQEKDFEIVGEAGDGDEAVRIANETKPDVILMDIVMPKLSGIEATRMIKQSSPASAVLILTAYSDISYILGLLEAGACGYLLKSARSTEVAGAIRAVRSGESVLDSVVTQKLLKRVVGPSTGSTQRQVGGQLTLRENEILRLAAGGMSNKEIADKLFLSLRTVKAHLTNIFNKMGCGSRTDAIIKGLKQGYITLEDISESSEN